MPKKEVVKIPPDFYSLLSSLEPEINYPSQLTSHLHDLIRADNDPFLLTKMLSMYSRHYKKGTLNSKLPSAILTTLCHHYKDLGIQDADTLRQLHQCAFDVAIAAPDMDLYKIVDEVYGLPEDKMFVIQKVKELLKDHLYKEAYRAIDAFDLEKDFDPDETLYPFLFLRQDNFVKKYLEKCPSKVIPFLTGLDTLAPIPNGVVDFLRCRGIIENKPYPPGYLDRKWLYKKMASYLEMFHVDINHCPNMYKHRVQGAIHYLFIKFQDVTMSYEAFEEMFLDTVANLKDIQISFLWKLATMSTPYKSIAVRLAEQLKISREFWPQPIMFAPSSPENFTYIKPHPLPLFRENPPNFLKPRLSESEIVMIDKSDKLLEAIKDIIENYDVVGVDAEWKPNLGIFKERVAILQLAVWDAVYLVDVLALNRDGMFNMWDTLMKDIFCNKDILKIGYGIDNDLKVLMKTLDLESMFANYKYENVVDFCDFLAKLKTGFRDIYEEVETWHDEVTYVDSDDCKGLALMCRMVLGRPLSKLEQFSNWERRPLRLEQMKYAALDAYCLLMAYERFYPLLKRNGLDWETVLKAQPTPRRPKGYVRPDLTYQPKGGEDSVKRFRAVVDHQQSEGTMNMLRNLGSDIVSVDEGEDPIVAIRIAVAENRVLFTRQENYENAIWYLPKGQVYVNEKRTSFMEVNFIFRRFGLAMRKHDFYQRCNICRHGVYIKVAREELASHFDAIGPLTLRFIKTVRRKEYIVYRRNIKDTYDTVHKNQIVQVVKPLSEEASIFFICENCGKLYWIGNHSEGNHLTRNPQTLDEIFDRKLGDYRQYMNKMVPR